MVEDVKYTIPRVAVKPDVRLQRVFLHASYCSSSSFDIRKKLNNIVLSELILACSSIIWFCAELSNNIDFQNDGFRKREMMEESMKDD